MDELQAKLFSPSLISTLTFLFFLYFLIKWLATHSPTNHKTLPPSPTKLPFLGNLHQLGLYAHRSLKSLSERYGPLMLLHFGSKPVLVVSSPDIAREITKSHDLIFSSRPKLNIIDKLFYSGKDIVAAPYGDHWRQARGICVLHLLNTKRVKSFRAIREEEVELLVKKIRVSDLEEVNLSEMFSGITSDLICRVAFGKKYGRGEEDGKRFHGMLGDFMGLIGSYNIGQFIPWLAWINLVNGFDAKADRTAREFDNFLDGIVEEHIRNFDCGGKEDLVNVLLDLQKNNKAEFSLDREGIKALILDMFAGGSDTSSTALEWTMTELIRNPRVMKELQNEVNKIAQQKSEKHGIITEIDLEKMQYLKMVIKEGLRLHPPFPLLAARETTQDIKLRGYDIAKGTMVITNAWAMANDPNTWTKPEEFWPERFLNNPIDFKGQDFEFMPFGAGRRGCPGISFSVPIIELVLANLVHNFNWELPGGTMLESLDVSEAIALATRRKNALRAIAIPVSNSA
ncbi:cytochrome P450 family 71 subfamily A polypeptide 25 [Euphorbia peplus]|nr:cytochrome P450 family 71 subfamily A polypeptide 25 [Euphorbia peplus]